MSTPPTGRRAFLRQVLAAGTLPLGSATPLGVQSSLRTSPERVIWAADPRPREAVDCCAFSLVVPAHLGPLSSAVVDLSARSVLVKTVRLNADAVAAIARQPDPPGGPLLLGFWFREPRALALDRCVVTVDGRQGQATHAVPLERYQQKTPLVVPFRGPGIVDQAWLSDNGHTNATEQFAVDLLALSDRFSRSALDVRVNADYDGWSREIIAPGAGVVAVVQDGIPSQPRVDEIDERSFTLADGRRVGYGNHVVIDHGNGEFSLLAHLQAGSIAVRTGQRLTQGTVVGALGSSGMSTEPHVHYQLQDRIQPPAHSLPFRFSNLGRPLRRGLYFVTGG
jgi:hypothetical protein